MNTGILPHKLINWTLCEYFIPVYIRFLTKHMYNSHQRHHHKSSGWTAHQHTTEIFLQRTGKESSHHLLQMYPTTFSPNHQNLHLEVAIFIRGEKSPIPHFVQSKDQSITLCMGSRQIPYNQQSSHHLFFIRRGASEFRSNSRESGSILIN